ncbi:hypothetical protein WDU94_010812 [Cyamophila willieti]
MEGSLWGLWLANFSASPPAITDNRTEPTPVPAIPPHLTRTEAAPSPRHSESQSETPSLPTSPEAENKNASSRREARAGDVSFRRFSGRLYRSLVLRTSKSTQVSDISAPVTSEVPRLYAPPQGEYHLNILVWKLQERDTFRAVRILLSFYKERRSTVLPGGDSFVTLLSHVANSGLPQNLSNGVGRCDTECCVVM